MSTTPDQERLEFEELCKNNPNYPKDFELHRIYQSHIKKWKPLIESNDPSIYSDWSGFIPVMSSGDGKREYDGDPERMRYLDNSISLPFHQKYYYDKGISQMTSIQIEGLRYHPEYDFNSIPIYLPRTCKLDDLNTRRLFINYFYDCYVWTIEKQPEDNNKYHYGAYSKRKIIEMFDRIDEFGRNPFDYEYYRKFHYGQYLEDRGNHLLYGFLLLVLIWIVCVNFLR